MNTTLNRFLYLTLFFLLLVGFIACENDIAVINTLTSEAGKKLPVESGRNVEIMYSDSAMVKARLTAPRLDRYAGKKAYMLLPEGMEVIFYNEKGQQQTKLTANYGIGFDNGKGMEHMEAKRNVVVINEKGERLNTEHLIWNAITKKIYTNEFVKITRKDEVIWGDGLEAEQDFSEWDMKNVQGQISLKEEANN